MEALSALFGQLSGQQVIAGTDALCNVETITLPKFPNLDILSIEASPRLNHTFAANPIWGAPEPITGVDFCNVTVSYTHPGWNDVVNVTSYLPLGDAWNGRFMANGGGGWIAGGEVFALATMVPSLLEGFAVSTTDAGHSTSFAEMRTGDISWALTSPGNVNWPLLVNFASVSLHDMATIGKAVTEAFYTKPPKYSYFFGGSTGGRQGYMLAQRYPKDFDGIIALFPAINWVKFLFSNIYPTFMMDKLKYYPRACELEAFRQAAITACDALDGLEDGIVSQPGLCKFDPRSVVGQNFDCEGKQMSFSSQGAEIASAAWDGPRSSTGEFQWYGFGINADLTSSFMSSSRTSCDDEGKCSPVRFTISTTWLKYWVLKDPSFDVAQMTHEQWDEAFHSSVAEYESIIGTSDPDLSGFRRAGGKMFTWHGTADEAIPPNGTTDYYNRVLQLDPNAGDFFRLFMSPGGSHSMDLDMSPSRKEMLGAIQNWVENGKAPEHLLATGTGPRGSALARNLCRFPKVQHYVGGDGTSPTSFECV